MSEQQYLDLLSDVLYDGIDRDDRTGTGTRSVFGRQIRFDLSKGFPLITTKKVHFNSIKAELLWFLSGSTNVNDLQKLGCSIWDEWARGDGDLGPVYGKQWRSWSKFWPMDYEAHIEDPIDQIMQVVRRIKSNPEDRGLVVSSWNVADLNDMALRPCHCLFQLYVANGKLSCQLYQRSADLFLGVPFNIASYALLTHMIAQVCGLEVGEFVHTFGDTHIYHNHFDQVREQLTREIKELPTLRLVPTINDVDDFMMEDISLINYDPHPAIKAPVAV